MIRTTLWSQIFHNLKTNFVKKASVIWTNCGENQSELTKDWSMETFQVNIFFQVWTVISGHCILTVAPQSPTILKSKNQKVLNKLLGDTKAIYSLYVLRQGWNSYILLQNYQCTWLWRPTGTMHKIWVMHHIIIVESEKVWIPKYIRPQGSQMWWPHIYSSSLLKCYAGSKETEATAEDFKGCAV